MGLVLGDGNPLRRITVAYVNKTIIMACVLVFVLRVPADPFAFVPAYLYGVAGFPGPLPGADLWQGLIGHMFVHGDVMHLVTNMVALWVLGDNVEDAMGHVRYAVFFLLCGVAGAAAEGALTLHPMLPLVGASGAISGVAGAYLLLHPRAKLLLLLANRVPVLVPASVVVGVDLMVNVLMTLHPPPPGLGLEEVAWGAHLGGFAAGMLLVVPFKRRGVPLFAPASSYPADPFPRIRRFVIDLFPVPGPDGSPASTWRDKVIVVVKAAAYIAIVTALLHLL